MLNHTSADHAVGHDSHTLTEWEYEICPLLWSTGSTLSWKLTMAGRFVAWMNAHEFNPDDYQVNTLVGTVLFENQESAAMWVLLDPGPTWLNILLDSLF